MALTRMDAKAMELWSKHAKMQKGRRMEPDEFRFALDEFAAWLLTDAPQSDNAVDPDQSKRK